MKAKVIAASVIVIMLSACRGQGDADVPATPSAPTTSTADPVPAVPAAPVDCPAGTDRTNPLPSLGVAIDVPCGLRSDRTYTTGAGVSRRQVTFEFIDATTDDALRAIDTSMLAAGYRRSQSKADEANLQRHFAKDGFGEVHVWANPDPGKNPKNPAAKGAIGVDLPASSAQ
jgi:hypothetical protein